MSAEQLLVIEDDLDIGSELHGALSVHGYDVEWVCTATQAETSVAQRRPELILLDLGLPDRDGVQLCRSLRAVLPTSVIVVLTARTREFEVIVALDAGADDYLTKPFRLTELLARLRAHLRRRSAGTTAVLREGALRIDPAARRAWLGDEELSLPPKEFDLLLLLVEHAGQVVTRDTLMTTIWDEHWYGSTKTLDVHVSTLRRKLAACGQGTFSITAVRGRGYRFECD
ncbi:response regulator transcription factor [Nocardia brasiliensis]|uniref:response regulator transcription factor n=1 Tax=Nocardia brasiliensis TaxID=37326 RepID=UPI0024554F89|nr:response regulator transcription factor [Nocardia brasiliensis]